MQRLKRLTSVMLAGVMTAGLVSACGDKGGGGAVSPEGDKNKGVAEQPAVKTEGFPIVEDPIKLTFFAGKAPSAPANWNDLPVWKKYAEMTNVEVNFQLTPTESLAEKRNLVLSGGDYPDAFHTARLSPVDVMNYGSQGIFIPLNDLIDEYAPHFKKLLEQYPEVKKGLTMPHGNIYSFPTFYDPDFKSVIIGQKLWYNQSFLDQLGMKEPETTDEFYEYLKAVKTLNPSYIPYAASNYGSLLDEVKGAWGLGNRGTAHRMDIDPETKELRYIPASPQFKEVLEYMNKLYTEGLFVDNLLTIKGPEVNALMDEGIVGSSVTNSPHAISGVNIEHFVGAPVLKGPHGDQVFSRARPSLIDLGAFVITDKNKHPEATVRWIDYFYSEEGSKLFFMGIKDESYVEKPDGTLEYTEEYLKEPSKYVSFAGGFYPAMLTSNTYKGGESTPESMEAAARVEAYWPEEVWPAFTLTQDELNRYTPLHTDINKYVDEMTAKFITGDVSFSEWDKYIQTIEKMGLKEYKEIYTAAYERYKNN
ncbi:extracellular solute-binding protein [Paenibacillus sp. J2TS4]|uniref:extracellular solute-binding protein n=1 Tax=Paenibacillus sp. J2TS4 TaxID=2807194 RepID=UPI001BCFC054|nr:extracellular solute-binding protein [Paenibacillus sp. J2TS4]